MIFFSDQVLFQSKWSFQCMHVRRSSAAVARLHEQIGAYRGNLRLLQYQVRHFHFFRQEAERVIFS